MPTPHEERLTEYVARAINKAAFSHHGREDDPDEPRLWAECRAVRIEQARAAISAYRKYDEQA